jgi:uncharacterized membrane protein HdeD (DUF308 family)
VVASRREFRVKGLALVGVLLLVFGVLSLIIPVPQRQDHSVKIGDTKIGLQTESRKTLPPAVGIVLLAGGVFAIIQGMRKT